MLQCVVMWLREPPNDITGAWSVFCNVYSQARPRFRQNDFWFVRTSSTWSCTGVYSQSELHPALSAALLWSRRV
jgi:ATP/ADP translocase